MAEETREIHCPRCEAELTESELGSLLGQFGTRKRMASGKNLGGRPRGKAVVLNSGGPVMSVVGHLTLDPAELVCTWADDEGKGHAGVFNQACLTEEVASLRSLMGRVEAGEVPQLLGQEQVPPAADVNRLGGGSMHATPRSASPFEADTARKQGAGWADKLGELEKLDPDYASEQLTEALRGVKLPAKWSSMKRAARVEWLEENSPMGAK